MLYNNKSELLTLLKRENLYTEKKLGQNFLFNTQIIEKIIQAADLKPTDTVVEIGPGLGILTMELLNHVKKVIAIEMDDKLIPYLKKTFKNYPNLEIRHQDVLKSQPFEGEYRVVANIPYYITSPIISHFLQNQQGNRPSLLVLLTQLEVAQKICVKDGEHSVLSLQTQLFSNPKLIDRVAPGNFLPAPSVDSAILKLETLEAPRLADTEKFLVMIKKAFSQKRKTIANGLNSLYSRDKKTWEELLEKAEISSKARPQTLSFSDWDRLLTTLSN
jgi:16S rRNA (adenine1518-N6/adenine1519-N6)-dimethyltransferase